MIIEYTSYNKSKSITLDTHKTPYVLQERKGLNGLETDIKTFRSIAQSGVSVQASLIRERLVTIKGAIVYDDFTEKEILKKNIYSVFNPAFGGDMKIVTDAGNEYNIKEVYIEEAPVFTEKLNGPDIEFFTISFICPNPFILSNEKAISLQNEVGNFKFDWEILEQGVTLSDIDANAIKNAPNHGDIETPVKITIRARGHMVDPFIINVSTGEAIYINYTLNAGDRIEITTEYGNKRVKHFKADETETDIFKFIDIKSSFFQLKLGDNLIKYGAKRSIENMSVDIKYNERYLGV